MAVATFADSYDFSGKTVITFCTSGGSPISDSTPDINKWFKGANVIEASALTRTIPQLPKNGWQA